MHLFKTPLLDMIVLLGMKMWADRVSTRRFQAMDPGRDVATEGGPLQESISDKAQNLTDDPIFAVEGDLAFNWGYGNNGARIVLTGTLY